MSFPNAAPLVKLDATRLGEQREMLSELTERFVVRFPLWLRQRIEANLPEVRWS